MVFRKAFLTSSLKIFMELGDVPSELEAHSLDIVRNIITYANNNDFSRYTSTLEGAWIASITGLNSSIRAMFATCAMPPELGPDEDYSADPLASFGIQEARLHRSRGVTLGMFLGLMKYYRQAYHDIIRSFPLTDGDLDTALTYINRFFDRLEIGFCMEWAAVKDTGTIRDLQAENRAMTNEKNRYLTIFESLFTPVIIMEEDNTVNNYNFAASFLFDTTNTGMQYYATEGGEKPLPPWLAARYQQFLSRGTSLEMVRVKPTLQGHERMYEVTFSRKLDVSGKYTGIIIMLHDVTLQTQAEEHIRKSEKKYPA